MADPEVSQMLGRIDGKLDQVIESFKEHREDDKRRFTEVYTKLSDHDRDINQAKGAKGAILWAAGGLSAVVGAAAAWAAKAFGIHP